MSDELAAWLRVQLDDDEQEAQDALKRTTTTRRRVGGEWVEDTVQPPEWRRSVWGPARVLRELDAKRKIIAEHDVYSRPLGERMDCQSYDFPCTTLRLLALPYADRPGYREEWRP